MSFKRWLIVALLAFLAWQWWAQRDSGLIVVPAVTSSATAANGPGRVQAPATATPVATDDRSAAVSASGDALPPEARETLRLIASNGPFPYDRDGVVFGNYERQLPGQARSYYHEYTVPTPGARNRGARRIITGGDPPRAYYYTDDHYRTFRQIENRP